MCIHIDTNTQGNIQTHAQIETIFLPRFGLKLLLSSRWVVEGDIEAVSSGSNHHYPSFLKLSESSGGNSGIKTTNIWGYDSKALRYCQKRKVTVI